MKLKSKSLVWISWFRTLDVWFQVIISESGKIWGHLISWRESMCMSQCVCACVLSYGIFNTNPMQNFSHKWRWWMRLWPSSKRLSYKGSWWRDRAFPNVKWLMLQLGLLLGTVMNNFQNEGHLFAFIYDLSPIGFYSWTSTSCQTIYIMICVVHWLLL